MEYNINTILQNKGFDPNKEMSSAAFTAYNIDMFGKETMFDNLIINNAKNTWYDKGYEQGGKPEFLLIKLGYADSFNGARGFMKRFVSFINPWISNKEEKPIQDESMLRYHERMVEHIYKLQTLAIMMKLHFDTMNLGFGKYYIENFDFNSLLQTDDFKKILDWELAGEKFNIQQNINEFIEYRDTLKEFRFKQDIKKITPRPLRKPKKKVVKEETLTELEWNKTISKMIEDVGDNPEMILAINKYRK